MTEAVSPPPKPPSIWRFASDIFGRRKIKAYLVYAGLLATDGVMKLFDLLCFIVTGRTSYRHFMVSRDSVCDAVAERLRKLMPFSYLIYGSAGMIVNMLTTWMTAEYIWQVFIDRYMKGVGMLVKKLNIDGKEVQQWYLNALGLTVSITFDWFKSLLDSLVEAGYLKKKVEDGVEYYIRRGVA